MSQSTFRWLVALVVSTCAMAGQASPALAYNEKELAPWLVCAIGRESAEGAAQRMQLEPANGATVPAGTPVVFTAESLLHNAPTFSVASSSAMLSSPDIDSGTGSQSGAFYRFTSTKATATPRTIYWTASFTFTPEHCESPSTFTTPVRTLTVLPSPSEEQATAKLVKIACTGTGTCAGKLTLTDKAALAKSKRTTPKTKPKTDVIGTAGFSIPPGKTASVEVALNGTGRMLLSAAHGHLSARLTILKSSPALAQTLTENVRVVREKKYEPRQKARK